MRLAFVFIIAVGLVNKSLAQDKATHQPMFLKTNLAANSATNTMALDSLKQRIIELKASGKTGELLNAMNQYGYLCNKAGQYDVFLQVSRDMAAIAKAANNRYMEAVAFINIGVILNRNSRFDSSSFYQYKALQIAGELNHDSLRAEAYACLAGIYNYQKNYKQSLEFCDKALQYAKKWKTSKELMVVCLGCKALAYTWLKQYKEAIEVDWEALPLAQAISNYDYLITIKTNLASNCVSLHRYDEAQKYLRELENDIPHYNLSPYYLATNMTVIGMIYWDMRNNIKATSLLLQQLPAVTALKNTNLLQRIYDTLGVIAETEHKYKDALAYNKLSQHYKLQIQKQNSDELFSNLEIRYQTTEKEKALSQNALQLAQKDLQIQKNRYYMYYTLAALVVALLIAALLYMQSRHKRMAHARELISIQQQRELQLLQALMQGEEKERNRIAKDLHDGVAGMLAAVKMHFSSVPAADDLLQTEGYRQGMKLLNEATQEIRKTSHNLMPEVLLQHGLDEALRRYCNNVNNSKALQIQYDSWGEIDRFTDSFELSVYRIVQELINNIMKHSKATQATVQLTQQDNLLSISIEDNGIGFSNANTAEGMGLRSLQSRIQAMNGKIEMQASAQSGVSAYLEFEVSELKKEISTVYE